MVLFDLQFYAASNFGEFISFGLGTVTIEWVNLIKSSVSSASVMQGEIPRNGRHRRGFPIGLLLF